MSTSVIDGVSNRILDTATSISTVTATSAPTNTNGDSNTLAISSVLDTDKKSRKGAAKVLTTATTSTLASNILDVAENEKEKAVTEPANENLNEARKTRPKKGNHAVKFDQDVDDAQARKSAVTSTNTASSGVKGKFRRRGSSSIINRSALQLESTTTSTTSEALFDSAAVLGTSSKSFFESKKMHDSSKDDAITSKSSNPVHIQTDPDISTHKFSRRRGRKAKADRPQLDDELSLSSEILTGMRQSKPSQINNEASNHTAQSQEEIEEIKPKNEDNSKAKSSTEMHQNSVHFALPSTFTVRSGYSSANESRKSFDDTLSLNFLSSVLLDPSTPVHSDRFSQPKSALSGRSVCSSAEENSMANSVACVEYFLQHGKRRRSSGQDDNLSAALTLGYSTDNSIFTGQDGDDDDDDDNDNDCNKDGKNDGKNDDIKGNQQEEERNGKIKLRSVNTLLTSQVSQAGVVNSEAVKSSNTASTSNSIKSSEQTLEQLDGSNPELLSYINQLNG